MLKIRFLRVGKKNQPAFKIVVVDSKRGPKSGKFVEEVGFWNPLTKEKVLRKERISYWLSKGAKLSNSVYNLLVSEKIIEGQKIPVHKKPKEKEKKEEKTEERKVDKTKKEEQKTS
jgi:small subunit ribosomal protein S16